MNVSARLMQEILDHYAGPPARKLWLLAWAEHASHDTRAGWCPRRRLAARVGVSERQATRIAAALVAEGVIKREGRAYHGHSAVYVLGDLAPPKGDGHVSLKGDIQLSRLKGGRDVPLKGDI